jgi:hypothetical protein
MEVRSRNNTQNLQDLSLEELEFYWVMAKNIEKNQP